MKKNIVAFILCILYLFCAALPAASATALAPAPDPMYVFQWHGHTLGVRAVSINPRRIQGNASPETTSYMMVSFECVDGMVPIMDIIENSVHFSLMDDNENTYASAAYMPYCIVFQEKNGVFSTAMDQCMFDMFFTYPADIPVESLYLQVGSADAAEPEEIPLGDAKVVACTVDETP